MLHPVHGGIGECNQCFGLGSFVGQARNSDAEAQLDLVFAERQWDLSDGVENSVAHDRRGRRIRMRKNDSELIATQASANVSGEAQEFNTPATVLRASSPA